MVMLLLLLLLLPTLAVAFVAPPHSSGVSLEKSTLVARRRQAG